MKKRSFTNVVFYWQLSFAYPLMRFINPKTDFAFKRIFGSEQSKPILRSFLNALLYDDREVILSLEILNPYLVPRVPGMKDTYVDVQAQLDDGTSVIIEMQVLYVAGFEQRVLYNAAKQYSSQLAVGDQYGDLSPIIALTITDFVMFPETEAVRTWFHLRERETGMSYPVNHIELVFVELPKFTTELPGVESIMDKWLFLMRNLQKLTSVPEAMQTPPLTTVFELANLATLTVMEEHEMRNKEWFMHDQQRLYSRLENALTEGMERGIAQGMQKGIEAGIEKGIEKGIEQGIEQGIEKGIEKGIEQGIQQGIERGKREQAIATARSLLTMLFDEQIAQSTGLSLEDVRALRQQM
jgi:predicted transposase/invertase (TIGR01784 family)